MSGRLSGWMDSLTSVPHDAALAYRRGGHRDLWKILANRSIYRVCRHGHLRIIAQPLNSFREAPPPPGVEIRQTALSDWPALQAIVTRRELNLFAQRLSQGMVGLVAWRGEEPLGYTWLTGRILPSVVPCRLKLPSHAAYLFDLYVVPAARREGIGSALVSARLAIARARGFAEAWRMVAPSNTASWRTLQKTAEGRFRIVAEIRYVKLLGRVLQWSS